MDNEQARFLLAACQPSGTENSLPEISAALEQAQRDPELTGWLAKERRSDAAIIRKMRQLEPPVGLRARLLTGGMVSRGTRPQRRWFPRLAIAATLLLGCGLSWVLLRSQRTPDVTAGTPSSLFAWQQASVGIFANPFFRLDVEGNEYPPLEARLRTHGARVVGELPFSDAVVGPVGCKILDWQGSVVSLACFQTEFGELVHLFVIPRAAVDNAVLGRGPHRAQVGDFATVTWRRDEIVVMVASKLPAAQLDRALAPDAQVARSDARAVLLASTAN